MKRARAVFFGAALALALPAAGLLLAGCVSEPEVEAPAEPDLCAEAAADPALIGRRQPHITGWTLPEKAESGTPIRFSATVSDTCGLVRARQWIFGNDTVAAGDSNQATYTFPPRVDDSLPIAFLIRDAAGKVREQRASISVGSWVFRSNANHTTSARFLTESDGQYVYLSTLLEYPDFHPVLLFLSRSGRLNKQVKVDKRNFEISSVIDNGDGTFIAAGGLVSGSGISGIRTSSPHAAVLSLGGSVLRDVAMPAAYSHTSVSQILRSGEGYLMAVNQELPYQSGTAVGSNFCPTVNHYVKLDPDWREIGRRSDSSFACGMVSKALPNGGGGIVVLGFERTDAPGIAKSFLVGIGPDLSRTVLDSVRGEYWYDMQEINGLYHILGGPSPFSTLTPPGAFMRTLSLSSGARNRISLDVGDMQPSRLLYSDRTLFVAGAGYRGGYGEADDLFVYRMNLQGGIERKYTNRIGDNAYGCDLARAGNNSILASVLLFQQQSPVSGLAVVNLDAEGRGVQK